MSEQTAIELFPVSRTSDPITSKLAERMIASTRPTQMLSILRTYLSGDHSDEQASNLAGIEGGWKRCADLRNAELIEATGRTVPGKGGTPVMVCRITDKGRRVLNISKADWSAAPSRKRRVAVADESESPDARSQSTYPSPQSDDLERRIRDTDTALAGMATEAYEVGEMAGFQRGYQQGIDAATKRPGALMTARHEGIDTGRRQQAQRTMNLITNMREQMKGKGPVEVHSTTCWQRHPMCAIDSIRKAQEIK